MKVREIFGDEDRCDDYGEQDTEWLTARRDVGLPDYIIGPHNMLDKYVQVHYLDERKRSLFFCFFDAFTSVFILDHDTSKQ